jgi:hypothetical protein
VEAKGATCKQADARVQGFDAGVGEAVNEGVEDRPQVLVDALDLGCPSTTAGNGTASSISVYPDNAVGRPSWSSPLT